jgi:fructokinase
LSVNLVSHDVVCLGEALVDFLPDARGKRVREVTRWTPHVGGAPANVAVGVARLGGTSALVGVTGDDEFGHLLKSRLGVEGVDTRALRQTTQGKTGLGFVSLTHDGERSFTFYRQRPAESFLSHEDVAGARAMLDRARVLHLGTNSLLRPAARAGALKAATRAARAGQLVSCDPNLRLHLWPKPERLKHLLERLLPTCAVVKLSHEEIEFVTGTAKVDKALGVLARWGVPLAVVTLGPDGAAFRFGTKTGAVPAPRVEVVDTTGAGDGFTAGLLYGVTRQCTRREELMAMSFERVERLVGLGCVVGSHVVQKLGAVDGLPRARQVRGALQAALR